MDTKILALALLVAAAAPAAAQTRWKDIGKTSAGNTVYIDPRSMKTAGGITTARIKVKFTEPVLTPQGAWKTSQHIAMFDCARTRVAAKQSWYYSDEAGTKVVKHDVIGMPGYGSPIGGSMTRVAIDYVCKK